MECRRLTPPPVLPNQFNRCAAAAGANRGMAGAGRGHRRIIRGERWFEAHRSHFYQRLVILGFSHKQVTLLECGVSFLLGIGGIIYLIASEINQILIFIGSITFLTFGTFTIKRLETQKSLKKR